MDLYQGGWYRAGMYRTSMYTDIEMPMFRTGLNSSHVPTISADFGHYRPVQKKVFLFYFFSFIIFEFLQGQNGNLFALTY